MEPVPKPYRHPDPDIEKIEEEVRKARFEQGTIEKFLSRRARNRMLEADIAKSKNDRLRLAYLAGYKLGMQSADSRTAAFIMGGAIGLPIVILGILQSLGFV